MLLVLQGSTLFLVLLQFLLQNVIVLHWNRSFHLFQQMIITLLFLLKLTRKVFDLLLQMEFFVLLKLELMGHF